MLVQVRYDGRGTTPILPMNHRLRRLRRHSTKRIGDRWNSLGALNLMSSGQDWQAFAANLNQLETAIQDLRQRFDRVQALQQGQLELEQHLQQSSLNPEELQGLKQHLEELEVQLESSLFDWRSLLEPFWQAVRFGGLGLVVGWLLKGIADS